MNKNMIASVKEMLKGSPVKVSEVKAKLKVKTKVDDFAEELKNAGFQLRKWTRTWMVTGVSASVTYEEDGTWVVCSSNEITMEPEVETASAKNAPAPEQKEDPISEHGFRASDLERWTKQVEIKLNNYYLNRDISTVPAHEVLTSILNSNCSFGYADPEAAFSIVIERLSKAGKVKLEYSDEEKSKWNHTVPKPTMWGYLLNILTPEPETTEPASADAQMNPTSEQTQTKLTEDEANVAEVLLHNLETLALSDSTMSAIQVNGWLAGILMNPVSQRKVLNKLINDSDIFIMKIDDSEYYKGRVWRTAENIAESLNMPIKDVHDVLYEALSEPGVRIRHCANDDTNFEYSAWPNILDVVRKFRKARDKPVEPASDPCKSKPDSNSMLSRIEEIQQRAFEKHDATMAELVPNAIGAVYGTKKVEALLLDTLAEGDKTLEELSGLVRVKFPLLTNKEVRNTLFRMCQNKQILQDYTTLVYRLSETASTDKIECEVAVLEIVDSCERPIEQQLILDRLATRFRRSEIIDALKVLVANGDINLQGRGGWLTYWPRGKAKPLAMARKETQ